MNDLPTDKSWSHEEYQAALKAYLQMLTLEQSGTKYKKTDFNSWLRNGVLKNRTASSIEFRMQNISAVLEELCLPRIKGYRPAHNIGKSGKAMIIELLATAGVLETKFYEPVVDEIELNNRVAKIQTNWAKGKPVGNQNPERISILRENFARDPLVKAFVLLEADGKCEACGVNAPFVKSCGAPFLEVHHVRTLSDGGSDKITNAVALCPNCHRAMHYCINRSERIEGLYSNIKRLLRE